MQPFLQKDIKLDGKFQEYILQSNDCLYKTFQQSSALKDRNLGFEFKMLNNNFTIHINMTIMTWDDIVKCHVHNVYMQYNLVPIYL